MPHPSPKIAVPVFGLIRAFFICVLSGFPQILSGATAAAEHAALHKDIPAQPLGEALATFARQTGLHVVYVSQIVQGRSSHAATAGLSAEAALGQLLEGTGLRFEYLTPNSVRILAVSSEAVSHALLGSKGPVPSLQEVLVTGSRIPVPANITATSPMQVITAEEVRLTGHTDTVDVISALPQVITSGGTDFGNHSNPAATAGGFTTADLRGLRPQRTVVLVNGRRMGLGDPNTANPTPAPDLDQIPLALVERVEVLTGGASATYGSDAIAGVINFILKEDVQGIQIDAQYGFAQHTQHNDYIQSREAAVGITPTTGTTIDGFRREVSIIAGSGFQDGEGHVTGYFTYQSQNAVHGSDRDFSDCSAHSTNSLTGTITDSGVICLRSAQSNRFATGGGEDIYSVLGDQFVPWPAAGAVPPAFFNTAPYYSSQRQDVRYQAGVLAHLDLNPVVSPYLELSFMNDRTRTQIAPSGLFAGANTLTADGAYLVNCSNPLLSGQEAAILCTPAQIAADKANPGSVSADVDIGRRNVEGGARSASYQHRNYRVVGGLRGKLDDVWSYDAYALYHYTSLSQVEENFLNFGAIDNALQVTIDPSGRPVCISGGTCVPYNIFGTGPVTSEQLDYLYTPGTDGGSNSEQIFEADFTGQLGDYGLLLPWAHEAVAVNMGAEHRAETLRFSPGQAELSGVLSGYGLPPVAIDKRVGVNEGFMEVRIPIAQDQPLARDLTIESGYRYSVYSTAGRTSTYKFGLQFAPLADIRLRAAYDRVVRAPNLIELYTPLSYGQSMSVITDPCAPTDGGATHAAASLAECMHTGVTAAQYGNGLGPEVGGTNRIPQCVDSCGVVVGGNPGLVPETANTWSLGMTLTPAAIPALSGTVDYFHIHLDGEIGTVPESFTLQRCLATGDPALCPEIVRSSAGALNGNTLAAGGYILGRAVNTGQAVVAGIDAQLNYRQPLAAGWGALAASLTGSWVQHNTSTPYRGAPGYDCAGLFGNTCLNGSVNPRWRHNLRMSWETPWELQLSALWRFIGRTTFDNNNSQTLLQGQEEGFFDPLISHIPNFSYLDLSAVWAVSRHVEVRAGVNNVFDKDPPFVPLEISGQSGGLNTFPSYDILGRSIFMALRASF